MALLVIMQPAPFGSLTAVPVEGLSEITTVVCPNE